MCDSGRMRQCVTVGQWQSVAVCCSGSVTVLIYHKMILVLLRWLLLQDQSPIPMSVSLLGQGCV